MFKVEIKNIKIKTKIGVSTLERKKTQLLFVSLIFTYNLPKKLNADNIKNLKDYSKIINSLKDFIINSRYKTLEKLILECKKKLEKQYKLKNIFLTIDKTNVAKKYRCDSLSVSQ